MRDDGMDYVFVSDVSGSMADDGKLVVSQQSVRAFVDALGAKDRFELVAFHVAADALFGELASVATAALDRAGEFLDGQRARGGTRLRPAIQAAYGYRDPDRQLNVVVLSDGMTEEGEHQELLGLIGARPAGVRVFCIGIGNEVNRPLLKQIAEETGGLAAFASGGDDFDRQAKAFRRKLLRPAIADVAIAIEGAGLYDVEPEVLPNLYHGSPVRLYARYRQPGPASVTLRGTIQGAPFEQRFEIELPKLDDDNPEIERMWAWHRVQRLYGEERAEGTSPARVGEIVRLCEGYSIVSEHASFLVLENDAEFARWKIERRNATRIARDRAAQRRLRERLEALRDRSARALGPATEQGAAKTESRAKPSPAAPPRQAPRQPEARPRPATRRNVDIDFPIDRSVPSTGGAVDPISGSILFGCAAAAWAARRRRRGSRGS